MLRWWLKLRNRKTGMNVSVRPITF